MTDIISRPAFLFSSRASVMFIVRAKNGGKRKGDYEVGDFLLEKGPLADQ